jgi:archaeal type IV pilus assembly protein PilA
MEVRGRRAVSPIIATLLLIAIAVAAGIIVYVFTNSLTGGLTQAGGQQVSEQVSMDAYNFLTSNTAPTLTLRNTGPSSVTIPLLSVYYDGNLCQASGTTCTAAPSVATATSSCTLSAGPALPATCNTGQYVTITLTVTAATSGTSHLIRVVTSDGGEFTFSVIAGRAG